MRSNRLRGWLRSSGLRGLAVLATALIGLFALHGNALAAAPSVTAATGGGAISADTSQGAAEAAIRARW